MQDDRLNYLFELRISKQATAAEQEELMALLADLQNEEQVIALFSAAWEKFSPSNLVFSQEQSERMLNEVLYPIEPVEKEPVRLWPRIAVAAAAVAVMVFGVWFYSSQYLVFSGKKLNGIYANDVAPGKNTATLTLADGKVINLSEAKTGVVVGANKLAYNDGTVVDPSLRGGTTRQSPFGDEVAASRRAPRNDDMMLTAATPRGGTYQIILPDGTKVWLNADSKISFPSQFTGDTRKVTLSGEAYFEVAKVMIKEQGVRSKEQGAKMPFIVVSNGQEVEVLGTHFNINAYRDEGSTRTTLLEGSVRISSLRGGTHETSSEQAVRQPHDEIAASRRAPRNDDWNSNDRNSNDRNNDGRSSDEWAEGRGGNSEVLKPGQQAVLTANANPIKVQQVDVNEAVAWKDGMFTFTKTDIRSIMRMISRWYNVEVVYQGKITETSFGGSVPRSLNISQILKSLELTGEIHFNVEGRRVTVMH
jgi:transmembrane sensor